MKSMLGHVHMRRSIISGFSVRMQVQVQHFLAGESLLATVD